MIRLRVSELVLDHLKARLDFKDSFVDTFIHLRKVVLEHAYDFIRLFVTVLFLLNFGKIKLC